jgi:type IV pilus assembly protein PilQ
MQRVSDRKLQLKLFGTQVPQYRKRPLITTRFESAVDRITPVQTNQMGDDAVVVFELRESVPFEIEQEENFIFVRFAASTVPPKPLEATAVPEWKKSLEGETAEATEVASTPASSDTAGQPQEGATPGEDPGGESVKWGSASNVLGMDEREIVKRVDESILSPKKIYTGEKIALNFYDTDIKMFSAY